MPIKKSKSYSLLDDDDFSSGIREQMLNTASRRKSISTVTRLSDVEIEFLDLHSIYFEAIIGSRGLPHKSAVEIIGQDSVGKSTLMFTIAGLGMSDGSPFFYAETESKVPHPDRIMRALDSNPALARKKFDRLVMAEPDDLPSAKFEIENFVQATRERGLPLSVPIIVALDSFSKLMSPAQAEGRSAYSEVDKVKNEFAETKVDFGHAKLAHEWCRELPSWLRKNNVIFLIVSHQNDKVNTTGFGGGGSFLSPEMTAGYNRTKRGGNATNQNAVLQLVLTSKGARKRGTTKVGDITKATVVKNSYGPKYGVFEFDVISRPWRDTDIYQQPALSWTRPTCEWLAEHGYFGTTEIRKKFSCEALDIKAADPEDFYKIFKDSDLPEQLGTELRVHGYPVPNTAEQQTGGESET